MGKRKLKIESWATDSSQGGTRLTLYFNRDVTVLEAEGMVHILKERLSDGK